MTLYLVLRNDNEQSDERIAIVYNLVRLFREHSWIWTYLLNTWSLLYNFLFAQSNESLTCWRRVRTAIVLQSITTRLLCIVGLLYFATELRRNTKRFLYMNPKLLHNYIALLCIRTAQNYSIPADFHIIVARVSWYSYASHQDSYALP